MDKIRLANVDIGDCGMPGTAASKIICKIYELRFNNKGDTNKKRYEAIGKVVDGCNQGYFQENYSYGPWRGRGDHIDRSISCMLSVVPKEHYECMKRVSQTASYEAEDYVEENL